MSQRTIRDFFGPSSDAHSSSNPPSYPPSFMRQTASSSSRARASSTSKPPKKLKDTIKSSGASQDKGKGKVIARQDKGKGKARENRDEIITPTMAASSQSSLAADTSPLKPVSTAFISNSSPIPSNFSIAPSTSSVSRVVSNSMASLDVSESMQSEEVGQSSTEKQEEKNLMEVEYGLPLETESKVVESVGSTSSIIEGSAKVDPEVLEDSQEDVKTLLAGRRIASSPRPLPPPIPLPQPAPGPTILPALPPLFQMEVDTPGNTKITKFVPDPTFFSTTPSPMSESPVLQSNRTELEKAEWKKSLNKLNTPPRNNNTRPFEPYYIRSPTGSLLSSLAPSPKPIILTPHTFTLEIECQIPRAAGKDRARSRSRTNSREPSPRLSVVKMTSAKKAKVKVQMADSEDDSSGSEPEEFDFFREAMEKAKQMKAEEASTSPATVIPTPVTDRSVSPAIRKLETEANTELDRLKKRKVYIPKNPSQLAVEALLRESRLQESRGWIGEAAARALLKGNRFLDSDNSDDEILPISDSQMEAAALTFDDDEDLTASAKKKSNAFKSKVVENLKLSRVAISFGVGEDLSNRAVWEWNGIGSVDCFVTKKIREGGWKQRVVEAFSIARVDGSKTISTLSLFSPYSGVARREDRIEIARWLLSLVVHPSTTASLADSAIHLLLKMFSYEAKSLESHTPPMLTATCFISQLRLLGFKNSSTDGEEGEMGDESVIIMNSKEEITSEERNACVVRLLRVLRDYSIQSSTLFSVADLILMVPVLIRLGLDPSGDSYKRLIEIILPNAVDSVFANGNSDLCLEMVESIVELYYKESRSTHVDLLKVLPVKSKFNLIFSKWVMFSLLSNRKTTAQLFTDKTMIFQSLPLNLFEPLLKQSTFNTFKIPTRDDSNLLAAVLCLQFLCRDLFAALTNLERHYPEGSTAQVVQRIDLEVIRMREGLESRVTRVEPVKAKVFNLLKDISLYNFSRIKNTSILDDF